MVFRERKVPWKFLKLTLAMGRTKFVKMRLEEDLNPIFFWSLVLGVPKDKKEKALLDKDIKKMDCQGLLARP